MKKQKNIKISSKMVLVILALSFLLFSCSPDDAPSLYDNLGDPGIKAEVTSILTSSGVNAGTTTGYAGISEITLEGNHFAPKAEDNSVYFGSSQKAEVLFASENKLIVKAPIIYGDSLLVRISKPHVEDYNDSTLFNLVSAIHDYYPFLANQEPYAVTSDNNGNVYFSYVESAAGMGVWKISADGTLSQFAPKKSELFYNDLKYHSDGYLLGVALKYKYAIFKIEENKTPVVWSAASNRKLVFQALDFDKNKNVWAAGKGGQIASFMPDKTQHFFDFDGDIIALRIFNDYLYAITGAFNSQTIIRFPIFGADSLGAQETYFDFSNKVGAGVMANSLTFDADGQMYIATTPSDESADPVDPILYVKTDKTFGTWYTGLITSGASAFTWSSGTEMFMIRDRYPADRAAAAVFAQNIVKVDMERAGAPEFGRE